MCGIAGILSWGDKEDPHILKKMTEAIAHRGPDAYGVWVNENISLGHRRLSVQDTSNAANQPMHDFTNRYTISFNGEIYNFKKLRDTLTQIGYQFKTHSDTEVILTAWNHWGVDALSHFEGMFAFALWDSQLKELYLVRDRFGEKPLYYFKLPNNGVVFASELKGLLEHPQCPKSINPSAISQFLSLNYILTDQCILENIHKLAPANYIVFKKNESPVTKHYWSLAESFYAPKWNLSESDLIEQFNMIFADTVEDCSLSDVQLGVFLSGGMDSSAMAAAMAKSQSSRHIQAFTIGFTDKSYDELDKAKMVANHSGIEHFWEIMPTENADFVKKIVECSDEPFADTSMIPMYTLSSLARKHATVCLSGDAGDELFGGYETYRADRLHSVFKHLPFKNTLVNISNQLPVSFNKVSLDYKIKQFTKGLGLSAEEAHYSWRTIFSDAEKNSIVNDAYKNNVQKLNPFDSFSKFYDEVKGCDRMEQHFYVDMKTWMADDILVKVDRMSMLNSLEVRAPFLNHKLAEWIIRLPTKYKINGLQTKYLFKKSQEKILPNSIIYGKKGGFSSPVSKWMNQDVINQIIDNPMMREWFDKNQILELWKNHNEQRADCSYKLFGLFCLSLWMSKFTQISSRNL